MDVEFPKPPRWYLSYDRFGSIDANDVSQIEQEVNKFIRDAWEKLFEGAKTRTVRGEEYQGFSKLGSGRFGCIELRTEWVPDSSNKATHSQILLKPRPLSRGVRRQEIMSTVARGAKAIELNDLLMRIYEDGLRD